MRALVHNCPDAMPVFEDRICYDVIVFLKGGWNSEYSNIANHIETAGKTPEFIVGHRTGESILNLHSLITVTSIFSEIPFAGGICEFLRFLFIWDCFILKRVTSSIR